MTAKVIIKELHYSDAIKAEIKKIENKLYLGTRRNQLRELVKGPMCAVCRQLPDFRIEYNLQGIRRIETYCELHFHEVYEKTKDTNIDEIIEAYGCIKLKEE